MAWCCQGASCYLNQYWPSSVLLYGVTRLQWFNNWFSILFIRYINVWCLYHVKWMSGVILGLRPTNDRWHYKVTQFLIGFRIQVFFYFQHNIITIKQYIFTKKYSWCSNHLRNVQRDCAKNTKLLYPYRNDRTINLMHINKNIPNFTVHSLQCEQTKEAIISARIIYCHYTEACVRNQHSAMIS